jgi:hypothetical protein
MNVKSIRQNGESRRGKRASGQNNQALVGCLLPSALLLLGSAVQAQSLPSLPPVPAAAATANAAPAVPAKMQFTNKQQFRLKADLGNADRQRLREVQLYVKGGQDGWACKETGKPDKEFFSFRAPEDGEYWFTIVTVDKNGKATPADVTREEPSFVVVVDTQPPEVTVTVPPTRNPDDVIRCVVRDANPDPTTFKLEYQGTDRNWHLLEQAGGTPGAFRCPDRSGWTGALKVTAADLAKNVTVREIAAAPAPALVSEPQPVRTETRSDKPANVAGPDLAASERVSTLPALLPAPLVGPTEPVASTPAPVPTTPPGPLTPPAAAGIAQPVPVPSLLAGMSREPGPSGVVPVSAVTREPGALVHEPGQVTRQIINRTHVVMEYRIDQVGPSGVGKVEVWLTADAGKTWERLCEDADKRSPVEFDLPSEGLYGVSVVVTNGNLMGEPPPTSGSKPDCWIEVDMTKPTAQLLAVRPVVDDPWAVGISWAASDKNLSPEPIDLYYALVPQGPWTQIARGVRNDGNYRWLAPHDAGPQFFVRLEVTDQAGNLTRCDATQPVVLDQSRPKATVLGVSGNAMKAAAAPTGN